MHAPKGGRQPKHDLVVQAATDMFAPPTEIRLRNVPYAAAWKIFVFPSCSSEQNVYTERVAVVPASCSKEIHHNVRRRPTHS